MIKKFFKILFIIIFSLVALLLIAALFIPKQYEVSVSGVVNRSQKDVFEYLKQIKKQTEYSVWVLQDPNVKMEYTGIDGTVGFNSKWDSKNDNVGAGSQTITKIDSNRIDVDLNFVRPFEGHNKASTFLKKINNSTTEITFVFYGNCNYPMNIMNPLGIKMIRSAETENLENIKKILEKNN